GAGVFRRWHGRGDHHRAVAHPLALRHRPQLQFHLQGPACRCEAGRARIGCPLRPRRLGAQGRPARAHCRQLIDATNGAHLWADRFDGSLEDVFDLQDKVASSVASVIEPTLQEAEIRRSSERPTTDLTAYDLYLRALADWGSLEKQGIVR